MANQVIRKIETHLANQGYSIDDLQDYLTLNGVGTPVMMVYQFPKASDLHLIASFIGIPPSELICLSGDIEATIRAILDELYPDYEARLGISREETWQRVKTGVEFRGRRYIELRSQVELFLDALSPPQSSLIGLCFLNCQYGCITKCRRTGRKPGA